MKSGMIFAVDGIVMNGLPMEPPMASRKMWENYIFWRQAAPEIYQTNKLAKLQATLVWNYDLPTDRLAHRGEV